MRWVLLLLVVLLIWWLGRHWGRVKAAAGSLGGTARPDRGNAVSERSTSAKTSIGAALIGKSPALQERIGGASSVPSFRQSIRSGCAQ